MEKMYPPQETAPPYPGQPMNYDGAMPQPGLYPQAGVGPPPMGYQGGLYLMSVLGLIDKLVAQTWLWLRLYL